MVTPTQHKIYEFIKKYIDKHGYSPSLTEIAEGIGIGGRSKSLISRYVHTLVKAGYLELETGQYRQIRLKEAANKPALPLLGRIAAGRPIEALSANEQFNLIDLLENTDRQERYALQVKGDSMIDEGIWDGDIILCEPRVNAKNGEIVVALIDEQEATLKRIQVNNDGTITLWPANPNLQPMIYPADRVRVQGVFVGLLRLTRKPTHVY